MPGQDDTASPTSPTPKRQTKRRFSHVPNLLGSTTTSTDGGAETTEAMRRIPSGSLEVTLTFPGISHERGDAKDVDTITAAVEESLANVPKALTPEVTQDSKNESSQDIYVKTHLLVHSIYAHISDRSIDWTLERKFAEARYSHFRVAFGHASRFMPFGVVALAINAGLYTYWERVGILLGMVMPIYIGCAYLARRREEQFLRLSGSSSEKLLIAALSVQTLLIVIAELFRPELDYGMLAMQMGYLNNFTPMSAISMQMVSAVFGLLPYCLAKIVAFTYPSLNLRDQASLLGHVFPRTEEDSAHRVGDLPICRSADQSSETQLVTSMLVPVTIFLYQVLVTYRRDESLRWDSLFKHNLYMKKQMLDSEKLKNEDMLCGMLPKQILGALMMTDNETVEPQYFKDVTVLFVEICDFDRLCSKIPARDVVEVLNIIYHEFDRLSDLLHVYKVETVAEVYMAVVGAPHTICNHADVAAHFALALMHSMELMRPQLDHLISATSLRSMTSLGTPLAHAPHPPPAEDLAPLPVTGDASLIPGMCDRLESSSSKPAVSAVHPRCFTNNDEDLSVLIRIGLNSGQLFAGVVGMDSPRYKLVGDTVNTASRMESTCLKGKIQVSPTTKARFSENMFILQDRGPIQVKGKGKMDTHFLLGYAGSETYATRRILIEKVTQAGHHSTGSGMAYPDPKTNLVTAGPSCSLKGSWSLWHTSEDSSRPTPEPSPNSSIRGMDASLGLDQLERDTSGTYYHNTQAPSRQNGEDDESQTGTRPLICFLRSFCAEGWGNIHGDNARFTCLQKLIYLFLLVPASEKKASRIAEINADKPYYLELKLTSHLEFARNLTIIMPLALSVVDLVQLATKSTLDDGFSYRNVILVRDLGNSFVALIYVFALAMFKLSRPMVQACTIAMLLVQFAALLTVGMFLWETERGIVAIIAMYGAYVLFYTVCTLLQRLALCATAITTYIVMKAIWCNGSIEALHNVGFLIIFIFSMTCSLWLQEHLSHVFHYEQRAATSCVEQIDEARNVGAQLLTDLLPPHVVDLVRSGMSPIAETYDGVTILFTDIQGFTKFSTSISPQRLCHVLNSMYSNFDEIISMWDLHKVEIIGDAYWVSAGCPAKPSFQEGAEVVGAPAKTREVQKERAEFAMRAVEVGLALIRALPSAVCDDTSLEMRIGIHTGSVVAGVVGKKGPRYHLFGTTVGYAKDMESSGIPGRVQISDVTHRLLEAGGYAYEYEERTVELEADEPPVNTWLVNKSKSKEVIQIQKKLMEERMRSLA